MCQPNGRKRHTAIRQKSHCRGEKGLRRESDGNWRHRMFESFSVGHNGQSFKRGFSFLLTFRLVRRGSRCTHVRFRNRRLSGDTCAPGANAPAHNFHNMCTDLDERYIYVRVPFFHFVCVCSSFCSKVFDYRRTMGELIITYHSSRVLNVSK